MSGPTSLIPSALLILVQTAAIWRNLGTGPFTGTFTWAHVIPHLFGVLLFFMFFRARGVNNQALSFGRSRARLLVAVVDIQIRIKPGHVQHLQFVVF